MTTTRSQDGFCKEHMASEGTFPDAASAAETAAAAALAPQLTASGKKCLLRRRVLYSFQLQGPNKKRMDVSRAFHKNISLTSPFWSTYSDFSLTIP